MNRIRSSPTRYIIIRIWYGKKYTIYIYIYIVLDIDIDIDICIYVSIFLPVNMESCLYRTPGCRNSTVPAFQYHQDCECPFHNPSPASIWSLSLPIPSLLMSSIFIPLPLFSLYTPLFSIYPPLFSLCPLLLLHHLLFLYILSSLRLYPLFSPYISTPLCLCIFLLPYTLLFLYALLFLSLCLFLFILLSLPVHCLFSRISSYFSPFPIPSGLR